MIERILQDWEPVIGLEVHAQLLTQTKIFCGCSTKFGAAPNSQTCPICLGHPGVLPVLNREVVNLALRVGLAIGASIDRASIFARKNYFYPDLPKGYQISQFDRPLCAGGSLSFVLGETLKTVGFTRIHLEEDAGKSLHPDRGEAFTRVDLNRCGTPLIEIVSEPDIRSPEEGYAFLTRLKQLLLYLEVNDGNMEEGSLRCDANVSVRRRGTEPFGTKVEVKNLNSFKNVERALYYEVERQAKAYEANEPVVQETRLYDVPAGVTRPMRSKEQAHDYRYFPEPDLKPLVVSEEWVEEVRQAMPELPAAKEARLEAEFGIPAYDARVLASTRALAAWYEEVARVAGDGKLASNWVMTEVMRLLNDGDGELGGLKITAAGLGAMLKLIASDAISGKIGKAVFEEMAATGREPAAIIQEKGLSQISDSGAIDEIVNDVIKAHPGPVDEYLKGKEATFQFLVGMAMKASRGRAKPDALREKLQAALETMKSP